LAIKHSCDSEKVLPYLHRDVALDAKYLGTFDIFHGGPVIGGTGNLSFREKSKFSISIGEKKIGACIQLFVIPTDWGILC
jgi:hypothetical protein